MTTPSREAIYSALFAQASLGEGLGGVITWGAGQTFAYTSRRVKLWGDLPAQPALCQAEHDEGFTQVTGYPSKVALKASWVMYHNAGADPAAVPAQVNNAILDAVEAALTPKPSDPGYPKQNTLGGLVYHCFIDGKVFKDPGDLDNQALIIVPITIIVP